MRLIRTTTLKGQNRHGDSLIQKFGHLRRIEYWNISWWVAVTFTLGSAVWVVNGFVAFLPLCNSSVSKLDTTNGWTAWIGATLFEFGAVFAMWEAWNREDVADFGWNVEKALHNLSRSDVENGAVTLSDPKGKKPEKHWIWYSGDAKYWHEIGFLAAFIQFCGASIFWISGFTAIPTIQDAISPHTGLLDGIFWTPQVVGGSGFIISSALLMLEIQKKWYLPEPLLLGWQIGFWNFIGGIGFTLCGALGYAANVNSGVQYQSSLSTFWGGWAFLIGSTIQWYESVNSV